MGTSLQPDDLMLSEIYGLLSEKEGYEVREERETYNYAGNCIIPLLPHESGQG